MKLKSLILLAGAVGALSLGIRDTVAADCDLELGKKVFAKCATCHTNDASGAHLVGPNLHGVVGRKAATAPEFYYSPAFEQLAFAWTEEELDKFLENPMERVPGTMMAFAGIKDESQRKAVICYMRQ